MTAKRYDITIEQGTQFQLVVLVKDGTGIRNLTGYTAKLDIKKYVSDATPAAQYSSPSSGVVVDGPNGLVTITITGTQTTAYTFKSGAYDLKITSGGGAPERILQGGVTVSPQVTV